MLFEIGLIVFFGCHLFTAFGRSSRDAFVSKIGAGPYKGLYSLVSAAGLALIVLGWSNASTAVVYSPPLWLRHVTYLLVLIAFVLLAAAYLPAGKIAAGAKHPMLAGVKVWAFAHLLSNGEVRSVILFSAFLAYAVLDRIAVKKRDATTRAAGPITNDLLALVVGTAAYFAVFTYLHPYIAGVALFP